ncbi:DctP family TRAP transporter solute-binding subunit [Halomonas sp. A29]|uniref:TRAP transporter substrate-binding protein n=1 Tax=Halomonas sp. A29 TaxID=3102786 RepID=UPI00398B2000
MSLSFRHFSLAAILAAGMVTTAYAQTTLRFAHPVPESDPQHAMATFFAEELEKRTDGALSVQIFPNGQLGNDAQMIDGARSGIIDITMVGTNNLTGLIPDVGAFELPFMFPTRETAYKVLDGEVGESISTQFEQHGLKSLGFPENGYRNMTNNRGPIMTPEDVKGLQMRVNNSRALNDMFASLGAAPQQLPVAELYTALETGVVDSQDHPIAVTLSFKFYEVQDYLSLTQHAYSALAFFMNDNKFNSLSPEHQEILLATAKDAVDMQRELSIAKEEEMIDALRAAGMEVNDDVDGAAFQEATKNVWTNFTDANGDAVVNAILEASR